jgi:hypothetical protein
MRKSNEVKKPFGIKLIAVVNGVAAIVHLLFWTSPLTKLTLLIPSIQASVNNDISIIYGLGLADLIWSVPLLTIGSIGLWKMKPIGWLAAQLVNVLYWYSHTLIFTSAIVSGVYTFGIFVFVPFGIFSFWAAFYLWKTRNIILTKSK